MPNAAGWMAGITAWEAPVCWDSRPCPGAPFGSFGSFVSCTNARVAKGIFEP